MTLLAAPIAAHGLGRVAAAWTGEPYPALAVTAAALGPALCSGVLALLLGRPLALIGWAAAGLAGAAMLASTEAPLVTVVVTAIAGATAAIGLPWAAARAPVPRGRTAILWGLLAALTVVQVARMSTFLGDPQQRWGALAPVDFAERHSCLTSYIQGAELARRGDANIYDDRYGTVDGVAAPELPPVIDPGPLTIDTYEYPPSFLILPRLMLVISSDFLAIRALWFALNVAAFAACAIALGRWLGGDARRRAALLSLAVALTPAVLLTLYFGNFQLAAMGLSALAMLWISRGQTRRGAALLAFTASAKIFPGVLVLYLLAARRFVAVAWVALFSALYALLAVVLFGTRPFVDFFQYHLPRLSSGATFGFLGDANPVATNLGVFGLPFKMRVFGWSGSLADAWALGSKLSWVYTLMVLAIAVLAGLRARTSTTPRERAIEAGTWFGLLALAALRSPFAPPAVLIPVFWGLSLRAATAQSRRTVIIIVALWIALHLMMPDPTPGAMMIGLVTQALVYAISIGLALTRSPGATR